VVSPRRTLSVSLPCVAAEKPKVMFTGVVDENGEKVTLANLQFNYCINWFLKLAEPVGMLPILVA